MTDKANSVEIGLDPKTDEEWKAYREQAHKALDHALDYLQNRRDYPAWQQIPPEVMSTFDTPVPRQGQGFEQTLADTMRTVLPYSLGNTHPGYMGWVNGTGSVNGIIAEMLAATTNPPTGGGNHAANHVKHQVLEWLKDMLGFPASYSGVVTSGCTQANLVGLAVARNTMHIRHADRWPLKEGVRQMGLQGTEVPIMTLYCSAETHNSVQKVAETLGFGNNYIRRIHTVDNMMDPAALDLAIQADIEKGFLPCAVVANAGTTSTGHIDPLDEIADVCDKHGKIWLHTDGAFGALVYLVPELRQLVKGMQRADSFAFDLHKWLYVPYDGAVVLVRDDTLHRQSFAIEAAYLKPMERGAGAGTLWYNNYGLELSQSFRSLKIWMSLKEHGADKHGALIAQNVQQAQYLADLVTESPSFELACPSSLNITCFRYTATRHPREEINREILMRLHESGAFVPSYTSIEGEFAIRACITNHRTRRSDLLEMVQKIETLGQQVDAEWNARQ